jgi:hypothetical protein
MTYFCWNAPKTLSVRVISVQSNMSPTPARSIKEGQNSFSNDMGILDRIQATVGIMEPVINVGVAVKVVFKLKHEAKASITLTAGLRAP